VSATVRELSGDELDGWDAGAVDVAGGHVYQSRAWADHRSARGWRPRYIEAADQRALVLERRWPLVGGGSGYIARGPVGAGEPWAGDGSGAATGEALTAIATHLAGEGIDVLAADPEVAADDAAYRDALTAAGFHPIPEIQPSRHRTALALTGADETAIFEGIAKATRQRIRRAERDQTRVLRWDIAPSLLEGAEDAGHDEPAADAFARFYAMLRATGDRRGFDFAGPDEFVTWWQRAQAAGHLVYLEARAHDDGALLGGLVLYRHGRRLSTVHSADIADTRRTHAGTMHLLRWRAIQLALAEGRVEMDLGGVDVVGARREPQPGEATYGLYEHKRSFGAHWVALAGAQERVARPWRYQAGRVTSRLARSIGGGRR
jgi:lipid II:glycine glycyltransferase (peptidoglycan interpeptide bridge formation enzyme)